MCKKGEIHMNKFGKKILTSFMCMVLAVFCLLPVSAANSCKHSWIVQGPDRNVVVSYDVGGHKLKIMRPLICVLCRETQEIEVNQITEGHDMEFTEIFDEPGIFHYNVRCRVCGFNYNK